MWRPNTAVTARITASLKDLFKDAVIRAVTAVFGRHIHHQGCFFHLTQASWRQIQQLGLVPLYKSVLWYDGWSCLFTST
jgi:hypothetical protein